MSQATDSIPHDIPVDQDLEDFRNFVLSHEPIAIPSDSNDNSSKQTILAITAFVLLSLAVPAWILIAMFSTTLNTPIEPTLEEVRQSKK